MQRKAFQHLVNQYLNGKATPEEQELLDHYYQLFDDEPVDAAQPGLEARLEAEIFRRIRPRPLWPRIAAAASVLLLIGLFILNRPQPRVLVAEQLLPLKQGVTLRLANGQQLRLQPRHSGAIARGIRQQGNLITYTDAGSAEQNTLTNNSCDKFSLILSDGSEAILDVGSSLTYPAAFAPQREVQMTGQAYFKVKHIEGRRFIVRAGDQTTEDLGTEFNIDAYDQVRTTLIEGRIQVNGQLLQPGQQFTTNSIRPANIEAVTAWLQGKIIFDKEPLENILAKVARIYGVQIIYRDEEVKHYTYFGSVSANKKLASVLNFFRKAGRVEFVVRDRTVQVYKKTKN